MRMTRWRRAEEEEGRRRSGGFFGSRQTKYNSASYKEGSRGDEGSPTLSHSRSYATLSLLCDLLQEEVGGEGGGCTLLKHEWITKSRVHSFAS